jgi:hypothetical protein
MGSGQPAIRLALPVDKSDISSSILWSEENQRRLTVKTLDRLHSFLRMIDGRQNYIRLPVGDRAGELRILLQRFLNLFPVRGERAEMSTRIMPPP